MVKMLKKGKKGAQANFVTRSKAVRKLQLKLSDFRRLCILKGVYPREPKRHPKGKDKVYYHIKDIRFLAHEKLLNKFREMRAFSKKVKKALGRGDKERAKVLKAKRPQISVSHLVKERYPSFVDAVRDLDDPLCLLSLYASLPSHKLFGIEKKTVERSVRLMREFQLWVIKAQALRKVFLSIKGIYYQAQVMGQLVTWVSPYQFTQKLPAEVDYKIMSTFLEFYATLLKFTNYKLYSSLSLQYPPALQLESESGVYNSYKAFLLKAKAEDKGDIQQQQEDKFTIDSTFQQSEEVQQILGNTQKGKDIFKGLVFWLNREVPRYALEFVLLSFGATVHWEDDQEDIECDHPSITHVIIDRPKQHVTLIKNKEFVQPQWVFDSINNSLLLPVSDYAPGQTLPPHLSPFVDNEKEEYIPQRQKEINELHGFDQEVILEDEDEEEEQELEVDQEVEEEEEEEEEYDHEKEIQKKEKADKKANKELLDMSTSVMTKKTRNIMKRINYGKEQKKKEADKLKEKAKKVKTRGSQ